MIKRYVERRSREAAQVTVTPVSAAQHCIPRSLNPDTPSDVHFSMEEKDESRMNPELKELEPPSAGTGLETPGQQCLPVRCTACLENRVVRSVTWYSRSCFFFVVSLYGK